MHKRRRKQFILGLLLVGVFTCVLTRYFIPHSGRGFCERLSSYLLYPVLRAQHIVVAPVKTFFEHRRSYAELEQEFKKIKAERDSLTKELIQLRAECDYFGETKELIAFAKRYDDSNTQIAQIVLKQFTDQAHYFLVDKGVHHGIKPDMVAVYKNNLVGKITHVYPYYSKLQLVTDKKCSVAVYCAKTNASGIHEGINQCEQTVVQYVSHLAKVKEGDWVLSSGQGLIFPKGFSLGVIAYAKKNGLYYDITVKPFVNLRKISHCALIQKGAC